MPSIRTEVEINRPPAEVRKVFLDFPKVPEWNSGYTIEASKTPVEKGDKLKVNANGFNFTSIVLENSEQEFRWLGSLPYIFSGAHYFRFEPSTKNPGGTTFVQGEEFLGLFSFLMSQSWSQGRTTKAQFEEFSLSLKKKLES